jgi:hypothetical protein
VVAAARERMNAPHSIRRMVRSNKYVVMALLLQRRIRRIARRNVIVRAVQCSILEDE